MTNKKFILKYLSLAVLPQLCLVGLVIQLTISSWSAEGQPFAQWPKPLLIQTMLLAFLLLNGALWATYYNLRTAIQRGNELGRPLLVVFNVAAIGFSVAGHVYSTQFMAGVAIAHLLALFLGFSRVAAFTPVEPDVASQ